MAMKKPTISMDPEVYAEAKAAADEAGMSFSAWLEDTARRRLKKEYMLAVIADWEAEHGAFTDEEVRESRLRLGLPVLDEEILPEEGSPEEGSPEEGQLGRRSA